MRVEDKVAIITGAAGGLGKSLAARLVGKGAKVIIADINEIDGERTAAELNASQNKTVAYFVKCDVTQDDQIAHLFQVAESHFHRVDIMVNNAGISDGNTRFVHDTTTHWRKVMNIDLGAVIEGTRQAIRSFERQNLEAAEKGLVEEEGTARVIINTASVAGLMPLSLAPIYTAAKFGVIGFTRSFKGLAQTQRSFRGIRVNAVAPSFADTDIVGPIKGLVAMMMSFVEVEQITDAFMMLIEDDQYNGDVAQITHCDGIQVLDPNTGNPFGASVAEMLQKAAIVEP